jgi:hypothetical protein
MFSQAHLLNLLDRTIESGLDLLVAASLAWKYLELAAISKPVQTAVTGRISTLCPKLRVYACRTATLQTTLCAGNTDDRLGFFHQTPLTRYSSQSQITSIKEHDSGLPSEETLLDNAHVEFKSDVERKFHFSHAAPTADKSPELVRQIQSKHLPKPIEDPRSCLWRGFVGYLRTGTAVFLHPRRPSRYS